MKNSVVFRNFKVQKTKLTKNNAMIPEDKITEIFCLADDFCNLFDELTKKYSIDSSRTHVKLKYSFFLKLFDFLFELLFLH